MDVSTQQKEETADNMTKSLKSILEDVICHEMP